MGYGDCLIRGNMIAELFVINRRGHLIFREEGLYNKDSCHQSYRKFHNVLHDNPDSPPYFEEGSSHFYHIESDGLQWVAVADGPLSALQVLCWLTALRDVVRSICGAATESALRANHLTLRQLAAEVMEDGVMQALDAARLRTLLLSRPCVSAPAPAPAPAADDQQHVYVDVVESVDCVVTSEGEVQRCEVTGRLEVRTEGTTTSRVDVSLAEDVRLLEAGAPVEAHLGPQVHITRLHPSGRRDGRWLSCAAGRATLLEYTCTEGCSGPALPVCFRAAAERLPSSADVELTLRVRLAAAERRAPSLGVQFRPPAGTTAVSATCTGPGGGVVGFDRQAALVTWTVRELTGQQEATAVMRLADAAVTVPPASVGPFRLSWEVSDHTVSGLRVAGVRLPGVPEGRTRRWVRHAAVSEAHTGLPAEVAAVGG